MDGIGQYVICIRTFFVSPISLKKCFIYTVKEKYKKKIKITTNMFNKAISKTMKKVKNTLK